MADKDNIEDVLDSAADDLETKLKIDDSQKKEETSTETKSEEPKKEGEKKEDDGISFSENEAEEFQKVMKDMLKGMANPFAMSMMSPQEMEKMNEELAKNQGKTEEKEGDKNAAQQQQNEMEEIFKKIQEDAQKQQGQQGMGGMPGMGMPGMGMGGMPGMGMPGMGMAGMPGMGMPGMGQGGEMNEDMMNDMLKSLEGMGEDPQFQEFMNMMMGTMLSKDILGPPMEIFVEEMGKYLKDNDAKLSDEEKERYNKQIVCAKEILEAFETDGKNMDKINEKMSKLDEFGSPPEEVAQKMQTKMAELYPGMMNPFGMGMGGMPGMGEGQGMGGMPGMGMPGMGGMPGMEQMFAQQGEKKDEEQKKDEKKDDGKKTE